MFFTLPNFMRASAAEQLMLVFTRVTRDEARPVKMESKGKVSK